MSNWQFGRASFPIVLPFVQQSFFSPLKQIQDQSLEKPHRGVAFVFFPHDDPSVRKSAKFGSRDRMFFKLFSQASIEVIVSFEESDHCFGALCEVIESTIHEFRFGCSEKRQISKNTTTSLSLWVLGRVGAATTPVS